MITDLRLAFDYYDKDKATKGMISMPHFRNILHNFGFHRMGPREIQDELKNADNDFPKRNFVDLEFVTYVVAFRWFVGKGRESGREEESRDAFTLFDKNRRGYATQKEIVAVLTANISNGLS